MMISNIKVWKMLNKRYMRYLAYMGNRTNTKLALSRGGIPMICEFLDVFLHNLSRLASEREVDSVSKWFKRQPQYPKHPILWLY